MFFKDRTFFLPKISQSFLIMNTRHRFFQGRGTKGLSHKMILLLHLKTKPKAQQTYCFGWWKRITQEFLNYLIFPFVIINYFFSFFITSLPIEQIYISLILHWKIFYLFNPAKVLPREPQGLNWICSLYLFSFTQFIIFVIYIYIYIYKI